MLPEQNPYRSSLWPHRTSTNPTQLLNPSETAGVSEQAAAAATMGQRQGNHGREGGRRDAGRSVGRLGREASFRFTQILQHLFPQNHCDSADSLGYIVSIVTLSL